MLWRVSIFVMLVVVALFFARRCCTFLYYSSSHDALFFVSVQEAGIKYDITRDSVIVNLVGQVQITPVDRWRGGQGCKTARMKFLEVS